MKIKSGGEEIDLEVQKSRGIRGLMFSRRGNAQALLFDFRGSLHSLFVFFPFIVLWLDEDNKIIDKAIVKPWTFRINTKSNYSKIVEIPVSRRYSKIVDFIDVKRFKKKND